MREGCPDPLKAGEILASLVDEAIRLAVRDLLIPPVPDNMVHSMRGCVVLALLGDRFPRSAGEPPLLSPLATAGRPPPGQPGAFTDVGVRP